MDQSAPAFPRMTFPLRAADNGTYLVDARGAPVFLHGDSAWSLIAKLTRAEAEDYLSDRAARGFNTVLVNLIEHKFATRPPRNAEGEAPFLHNGAFNTPNDAYFAHADWVIRCAARHGIAVLLAPAYLGQHGGDEGFYQEMQTSGSAALHAYGEYVGARYAAFENVIWVLGGDYLPPAEGLELVRAVGEGIRRHDTRHLFTAHWSAEVSALDVPDPAIRGWLNLNTTYTYASVYAKSLHDHARALPHVLIESAYENEHDSTPQSLRAQAYAAVLSGATGQVFGSSAIWGFWSWRRYLDSDGSRSMTHLRTLLDTLPWQTLVPDLAERVLRGAHLASTPDGNLALAYVPSSQAVRLDTSALHVPLRARWYDPASGRSLAIAPTSLQTAGLVTLTAPGANAAGDADWVLVVEHAS